MNTNKLKDEFDDRGPWVTKYNVNGKTYGGNYDAQNDKRLEWFFQYFPNVKTIMELGSLEGGHTIALAKHPGVQKVLGIEGRKSNIDKARFVQQVFGIDNTEFIEGNIEKIDLSQWGQFDAVFCVGLLYHLPAPWNLIEQISKVTRNLYIWTHYATESDASIQVNGYRGLLYEEKGIIDPLSGMSQQSFWPTLKALRTILSRYTFSNIQIIEDDPYHQNGPCVTLAAKVIS